MSVTIGRLIPWHACDGTENMAVDQALLESVDTTRRPVLRLYGWTRPTLSLGYFQRRSSRSEHPESRSIDCVRRATGGGAIIHHHELTYSVTIPNPESSAGPRLDLYQRTHRCLVEAMMEYGVRAAPFGTFSCHRDSDPADPFLCFQRRTCEDLIVSGYKVVGSAQRRSRRSVLQHGSVLLRSSCWAPQLPGIEDLTSHMLPVEQFGEAFQMRMAAAFSIDWRAENLTESERQKSAWMVGEKFGSDRWMNRR